MNLWQFISEFRACLIDCVSQFSHMLHPQSGEAALGQEEGQPADSRSMGGQSGSLGSLYMYICTYSSFVCPAFTLSRALP